ncbi:MAG: DNA cytosine methyltransferase [Clostridia bacterium]|nr:DNA cytosine methyltransferase [Clostridia bacterium]
MIRLATVFSGIGAIEQALKQLGIDYKVVFACDNGERYLDIDQEEIEEKIKGLTPEEKQKYISKIYNETGKVNNVKKSYFANYDISEDRWYEDIRFLDGNKYKGKVDLIVGGSPCQSFSTYGKKRGLEDTRGTLFYDYARLIKEIQPKVFIFENVKGLLSHDKGRTWSVIKDVFESLNYKIKYQVINACDYGLPQLRKRVFVVGINKNIESEEFSFPDKIELEHTAKDYLDDEVDDKYYLPFKGFRYVTTPERNEGRARVNRDIIGCETANQQFNWIGDFRVEKPKPQHYNDPRIYIGEYEGQEAVARKMTPQECLKLMGFQDFNVVVDDKTAYRQAGNSIAVPVLKEITKSILNTVNFDGDDSNGEIQK